MPVSSPTSSHLMPDSSSDLSGRVAVVTGASRGLGRRIAIRLAGQGASVMVSARSGQGLTETAATIKDAGGTVATCPADLSNPDAVKGLAVETLETLGTAVILVNAVGVFGPIARVRDVKPQEWIDTLMVNSVSHFLTCNAFVGGMIDTGWGRIVNVTSAAALHDPGPLNSAYATSKVAVNRFTRHLAAELTGTGVTANVIHPGEVKTEMWAYIRDSAKAAGPEFNDYRDWVDLVEQTGGDDPEKAADLVSSLMNEDSGGISGRFLWIDGGLQSPISSWSDTPVP
jgi:NAD(P)-dependent dehydrogenase (short-subunit alcohol dehydrogenase family)